MSATAEPRGRLAANVAHFVRLLRAAGLPLGPDSTLDAIEAVRTAGVGDRADLRAALAAVLVRRRSDLPVFEQAFELFWQHPRLTQRALQRLAARAAGGGTTSPRRPPPRRIADALAPEADTGAGGREAGDTEEGLATLTWTDRERLQHRDFESLSAEELARAHRLIRDMAPPAPARPTRRYRPDPRGTRVDPRASLRAGLRGGSPGIELRHRQRQWREPPLVILCDISGSMSQYARTFLHFLHALMHSRERVEVLLFGTRLTRVTRLLRARDVDEALAAVGGAAPDWSGGTRIGAMLGAFNRRWARRLLGQGAVVVLLSDGLDRDPEGGLAREAARLHRLSRRLIWVNPLLRWSGFEARAGGVRALLPHVDEFRPVHSLHSLEQLARALGGRYGDGERADLRAAAGGG
ncbi:VWA domain-containing protein [Arhodomonas aquaeolei]|uniref:vWA domain-containing protein n=1 Tax=Arhodomonas aquaeolei TaxID=2369 RepID=UPI00216A4D6E|nr:VWA domain-containing protein [Arhodomonas aquaeolei]MCS4503485.1 VWA domain-containing protein [Arhodomonas aquaeolei]